MSKGLTWRIGLIVLFLVGSFVYLIPDVTGWQAPFLVGGLLPKDKIHLGLDLQGGTHLVLEVETQKAVEGRLDLIITDLEDTLNSKTIRFKQVGKSGADRISVTLYDKGSADTVAKLLKEKYPQLELVSPVEEGGFYTVALRMGEKEQQDTRDKSVAQALETIRNRIDQFGVSEPVIQREGINHIVVQLPGIKDPKRAIELIGKTARLEFKLVDEGANPAPGMPIPPEDERLTEKKIDPATGAVTEIPLVLKRKTLITGDLLTDAQVRIDSQYNQPYVAIEFNSTRRQAVRSGDRRQRGQAVRHRP